jgi:DNA-binding HxlR family transcriptional regulator
MLPPTDRAGRSARSRATREHPARAHRSWTPLAHALTATGDQWTLRIVLALGDETLRLSELQARLPGISVATLSRQVQHMNALGLLTRRRIREAPPRVLLALTGAGIELLPLAAELARWGMRNLWEVPAPGERLDASSLLEALPTLVEGLPGDLEGVLELVLTPAAGRRGRAAAAPVSRHVFGVRGARLWAADEADRAATARVEGSQAAWVAALGPARDRAALRFNGDQALAGRVLQALPRPGGSA